LLCTQLSDEWAFTVEFIRTCCCVHII
jgi:hypothetical protein